MHKKLALVVAVAAALWLGSRPVRTDREPPVAARGPAGADLAIPTEEPPSPLPEIEESAIELASADPSEARKRRRPSPEDGTPDPVVAGRVVDDTGRPVTEFWIVVRPIARTADGVAAERSPQRTPCRAADGRFALEPGPGTWEVRAEATGHGNSEFEFVVLPDSPPIELVCPRTTRIAGTVTDPFGQPIAGAAVGAYPPEEAFLPLTTATMPGWPLADTSQAGHFVLEIVGEGRRDIIGVHTNWAASAPRRVELDPGNYLPEVDLVLREGGKLDGMVYRSDGSPDPGQPIGVNALDGDRRFAASVESDATGRFVLGNLVPGRYEVFVIRLGNRSGDPVGGASPGGNGRFQTIEVHTGQTTEVTLGLPSEAPVHLVGTVTTRGTSLEGGLVWPVGNDGPGAQSLEQASVQADGTYEMTLAGPGHYMVLFRRRSPGPATMNWIAVTVPQVAEYELKLAIPEGRIAGRLLESDGRPAAGKHVVCAGDAAPMMLETMRGIMCDESGAFEFRALPADRYTLRTDARRAAAGEEPSAVAIESDLVLEPGGSIENVVLQLPPQAEIAGIVTGPDGAPLLDASIFVHDARGRILNPSTWTVTSAGGRFRFAYAAGGTYTVGALAGELVAPWSESLRVEEGERREVRLQLKPGTALVVSCSDEAGVRVPFVVRVLDGAGRRVDGLVEAPTTGREQMVLLSISYMEQRVGPLPPGEYRIEATGLDGRTASRRVELDGRPRFAVELVLPD